MILLVFGIAMLQMPPPHNPTLRVQFYNPENDDQGMINKVVAWYDPPYCHVELHLPKKMPDDPHNVWSEQAISIHMNSKIHCQRRTFKNAAYETVHLHCTLQQLQLLKNEISCILQQDIKFSTAAMLGSYYGLNLCPENHTFCSKLVGDLLQSVGLLPANVDCNILSPSQLYRLLLNTPSCVQKEVRNQSHSPAEYAIDWSQNSLHGKLLFKPPVQ